MTPKALADLRALAEAATPGPWERYDHQVIAVLPDESGRHILMAEQDSDNTDADAAYIAALSPDVVLALLERVERAEAALDNHSDPRYRPLMLAVRAADEAFEKAGDAGTKTWLDDYFLPELEAHGLTLAALDAHRQPTGGQE